jgi:hypothetical protein
MERAVVGCLLEKPELWSEAAALNADHFLLADHRKIFSAIADLNEHHCSADIVSVADQLGESVPAGVISALVDGAVTENFHSYISHLCQATRDRRFQELHAKLGLARKLLQGEDNAAQNWRSIFHTVEEFENAPPLRFAINGFLQEAGVTLIGGLSGHGKTLLMLAMAQALLEGAPLFGYESFSVLRPAQRVLYLIPESSLGPFWSRIKLFRLEEHARADRLLTRTLSSREQVSLDDPRLLKAAEGADVFLDTAVRFMAGAENDVESTRPFADTLFRLLSAGARSITGAHHAPKGFEGQDYMTLENILRGSGDIGAMLSTAWGVRQIDAARNRLFVQNIKPRDFQPCEPFILEGRPHLDTAGQFKMIAEPGEAGELREHLPRRDKNGRPATADKAEKMAQAATLRAKGCSLREIAEKLGVSKSGVSKWLFEYDLSTNVSTVDRFVDKAEPGGETPN